MRLWPVSLAGALVALCLGLAKAQFQADYLPEPQRALAKRHIPFGLPSTGELLFHRGYVAGHNNWLKIPNWVAYHLPREKVQGDAARSDKFVPDPELKPYQRSEPADYRESGFDRGHLAPAADMKSDNAEMADSFLMSNITPQVGKGFNRGIWKKLEDRVRRWAQERGEVWVVTGPVFVADAEESMMRFQLIGKRRVAVPTHFFKIVYSRGPEDELRVIAFLLPNAPAAADNLPRFTTAVDAVEEQTGLDFFNALDDELEDSLESRQASSLDAW